MSKKPRLILHLRLLGSRQGSGLIQVLVVAGITGFLSIAIASLLTSSMRGQRAVEVRDAVRITETELLSHLSDSTACTRTLGGLSPLAPGASVTQIKRADNSVLHDVGAIIQNNMLRLGSLQLRGYVPHDVAVPTAGRALLVIRLEPLGDPVGPKEYVRNLGINAELNGSNQIINCTATGSSGSQFWLSSPSVADGIYTASQFVGIGTATPAFPLTVQSNNGSYTVANFRGTNSAGASIIFSDLNSTISPGIGAVGNHLTLWSNSVERIRVTESGNVGIGTSNPQHPIHVMATAADGGIIASSHPSAPTGNVVQMFVDHATDAGVLNYGHNGGLPSGRIDLRVENVPRLSVLQNGNVGIGTVSPSYKLDVNGTIRGYGITDSSDIRLKHDVQPLQNDLDKILNLQGVSYYWNDAETHGDRKQVGVIAQEVEKVYPELVETDKQGMKSVNYSHFVAPLIEAVKTLYKRLTGVEAVQSTQAIEIASKADKAVLDAKVQQLEAKNQKTRTRESRNRSSPRQNREVAQIEINAHFIVRFPVD